MRLCYIFIWRPQGLTFKFVRFEGFQISYNAPWMWLLSCLVICSIEIPSRSQVLFCVRWPWISQIIILLSWWVWDLTGEALPSSNWWAAGTALVETGFHNACQPIVIRFVEGWIGIDTIYAWLNSKPCLELLATYTLRWLGISLL